MDPAGLLVAHSWGGRGLIVKGSVADPIGKLYVLAKAGNWTEVMPAFALDSKLAARCSRYRKPSSGWTFLHQAAYHGYECGARTLIRLGACVPAEANDGETPLMVADRRGHRVMWRLLDAAAKGAEDLWSPSDDPEVLPSSAACQDAAERWACSDLRVRYAGAVIIIPAGSRYFVDTFERVLVGWHGTYDPPRGMDAEPMIELPQCYAQPAT